MPSLSYKKQFAPKILDGSKIHTIRRMRKRPIKVGDTLYHFTGLRTKNCQRLLENKCVYVYEICIEEYRRELNSLKIDCLFISINRRSLLFNMKERERLAINDGFNNYEKFKQFFLKIGLPFVGQLIGWTEYPGYGKIK